MKVRRGPVDGSSAGGDIVYEAETLLAGDAAASFQRHRQSVPAWAWMNFLAHSSLESLTDVLASHMEAGALSRWGRVIYELTATLLARSVDQVTLARIQQRSLIPLELSLLSATVTVQGPEEFATLAHNAIDQLQI